MCRTNVIERALNAEISAGRMPGAVVGILRGGETVYLEAFGYRDPVARTPMTTDTLFWLASMTKPMVTAGALKLYERGLLILDTPIGELLPALADRQVGGAPAHRQPTVLDLLRHTSGMVEGMLGSSPVHELYTEAIGDGMTSFTGEEFVERLAPLPLLHQPGEVWHYGWGLDLVGQIIEGIVGRRLGDYLREQVFEPAGMNDTAFGVSDESRYARALDPTAIPDLSRARFDSGGAGLVGTAPDYLRFIGALLGYGELLHRKTREFMTTDQLPPGTDESWLRRMEPGYGFGLGVAVRRGVAGGPTAGSPGEFTWAGAGGTYWWADPAEDLGVVFLTHAPDQTRRYFPLIRALVLQSLD
ncbi:serine hydrolase domain-containing protein [Amycolatopsis magusensis]|uniref:serine hydrolase domain-containing protein n=1 Tax=Amycolatopsis magusensis TaxID=882444 RepID=UPI003788A062